MKTLITIAALIMLLPVTVTAADPFIKVNPHAYGLGVHSDQYGRVIEYKVVTPPGTRAPAPNPFLRVTPNAYGLGVGMDQFGRPVRAVPKY